MRSHVRVFGIVSALPLTILLIAPNLLAQHQHGGQQQHQHGQMMQGGMMQPSAMMANLHAMAQAMEFTAKDMKAMMEQMNEAMKDKAMMQDPAMKEHMQKMQEHMKVSPLG